MIPLTRAIPERIRSG